MLERLFGGGPVSVDEEFELNGNLEEEYFLNESKEHFLSKANLGNNIQVYSLFITVVGYQFLYTIRLIPGGITSLLAIGGSLLLSWLLEMWLENMAYREAAEIAETHTFITITPGSVYEETLEVPEGGWIEISNPEEVLRSVEVTSDAYKYLAVNAHKIMTPNERVIPEGPLQIRDATQDIHTVLENRIKEIDTVLRSPAFDIEKKVKKNAK